MPTVGGTVLCGGDRAPVRCDSDSPPLESSRCQPLPPMSRPDFPNLCANSPDRIPPWKPPEPNGCGNNASRRRCVASDLGGGDEAGRSPSRGVSHGRPRPPLPGLGSAACRVRGAGNRLLCHSRGRAARGCRGEYSIRAVRCGRAPGNGGRRPVVRVFRSGRVPPVLDTLRRQSPPRGCVSGDRRSRKITCGRGRRHGDRSSSRGRGFPGSDRWGVGRAVLLDIHGVAGSDTRGIGSERWVRRVPESGRSAPRVCNW